jgi:hypothetical protein
MARETDSRKVADRSVGVGARSGWVRARAMLVAGALSAGALAGLAGLDAVASADGASAVAARTLALNETGHLRRTSSSGIKLNEQGSATGTIKGAIYIHLDLTSPSRARMEVSIYPSGGSITGIAYADYRVSGPTATFSGSMSVTRGTGSYAKAHGSGLSFSGTIQRVSGAATVRASGTISF